MNIDTKKWRDNISRLPEDVEREYDRISYCYDDELTKKGYLAPKHASELLQHYISDTHAPILDAGCGTGLFGQALSEYGFSNITGIDISSACLQKAKEKDVYIKCQKQNLLKVLPFADNSFACVSCVGVFSRFDELQIQSIVREYARVTQENGFIIFSHRDDLVTAKLKNHLNEIKGLKLETLTESLAYFSKDEYYKNVNIRFFVLKNNG